MCAIQRKIIVLIIFQPGGLFSSMGGKKEVSLARTLYDKLPQPIQIAAKTLNFATKGILTEPIKTIFTFKDDDQEFEPQGIDTKKWQILKLEAETYMNVSHAKRWYYKHVSKPDYGNPYIYFPANFQPERSTVPDAALFFDFALILKMLDRTLPDHWDILYKEHPRTFREPYDHDNPRDTDALIRMKEACPRLKFIDQSTHSVDLIKNCKAVAVASGTTGWEAMARGKPVLSFGEYWYIHCEGVHIIDSLDDLKTAVKYIQDNPEVPASNVENYLAAVQSVSEDMDYFVRDNIIDRASDHLREILFAIILLIAQVIIYANSIRKNANIEKNSQRTWQNSLPNMHDRQTVKP